MINYGYKKITILGTDFYAIKRVYLPAAGGGARSKLWRQIIADVSGKKVLNMSSDEASSLRAGISAAVAAEWFPSFDEAAKNDTILFY